MGDTVKTRAAYMKTPSLFEIREIELPATPPAVHVLVRVEACGVCGTDVSAAESKATDWKPFGHEIAGTIERVGQGVAGLSVGQAIVLESSSSCGVCDLCRNARSDLCRKAPHFWNQPAMGMSDLMIAPAQACVPYAGLDPAVACLTEPAGVAYDMVRVAEIRLGDKVCVVGPGPIGLMALAMARASGAVRLACIGHSHSTRRMELVRELGAEPIVCDGPITDLGDEAGQFDHVLMTAPTTFIEPALSLLAYEGTLTYIGLAHGDPTISFDADAFHFRKLQLRASFAAPAAFFPRTLSLLTAGIVPGDRMISHRFPLDQIAEAMRVAREDKASAVKVVIQNP